VLEIPTPNWLAHDRKVFGGKIPKEAVIKEQESAYTSPIWYTREDEKPARRCTDRLRPVRDMTLGSRSATDVDPNHLVDSCDDD